KKLKEERENLSELLKRNPDITQEEFLECYRIVCNDTDSTGSRIKYRFGWLAKGFDEILVRARNNIVAQRRREQVEQGLQDQRVPKPEPHKDSLSGLSNEEAREK